jgi:hypothetical protein
MVLLLAMTKRKLLSAEMHSAASSKQLRTTVRHHKTCHQYTQLAA